MTSAAISIISYHDESWPKINRHFTEKDHDKIVASVGNHTRACNEEGTATGRQKYMSYGRLIKHWSNVYYKIEGNSK